MDSTSRFVNGVKNPLRVVLDVLQESGFLDVDSKEPVVRFLHPQELQVSEKKRRNNILQIGYKNPSSISLFSERIEIFSLEIHSSTDNLFAIICENILL